MESQDGGDQQNSSDVVLVEMKKLVGTVLTEGAVTLTFDI